MASEEIQKIKDVAESVQETAERVHHGIHEELKPDVKDARLSAYDAFRIAEALSRRVTILFSVSILINALTLLYVLISK